MKFRSYDTKNGNECETEIISANPDTIELFVQTWVPDYVVRILREPENSYSLFPWDKIIKKSELSDENLQSFCAVTDGRVDGLLCLRNKDEYFKVEYIGTAPWNYGKNGKMRRIGTGLIYFTISQSLSLKHNGTFKLNALSDAEPFYHNIGMVKTGILNPEGLKEFYMNKKKAKSYMRKFEKFLINENNSQAFGRN